MIKIMRNVNDKLYSINGFFGKTVIYASELTAIFIVFINIFTKEFSDMNIVYSAILYSLLYLNTLIIIGFSILKINYLILSQHDDKKNVDIVHEVSCYLFFPLLLGMLLSFSFSNYALAFSICVYCALLTSTITKSLFSRV